MHLIDTFQGTFEDVYAWGIKRGMENVGIEQVKAIPPNFVNSWGMINDPEKYFRFIPVNDGLFNVGLWRLF